MRQKADDNREHDAEVQAVPTTSRSTGLVDSNLPPEAEAAAKLLRTSLVEPLSHRAAALFCDTVDYDRVHKAPVKLIGNLMLGCLHDFVREMGGQVVYAAKLERGQASTPKQHSIEVNGRVVRVLARGSLFLALPRQRVVVSVEESPSLITSLDIRSDGDAAAFWKDWRSFSRQHHYLRGRAFLADGELIKRTRAYSWASISLPEQVKQTIQTHVAGFLKNRQQLRDLGVKGRRGLILSGPPGVGKSLLGKVLADVLDVSFLWVTPRHVGDADSFADILAVARFVSPVVVFLEDLDLFAGDRDLRGWTGLGELMNQLDGATENEDIVTIATTNRLEVVETALRNRPGRFDRVLELGYLDGPARRDILTRLLAKVRINPEDLGHLVTASEKYTGAQVEELANTVLILATQRNAVEDRPARVGTIDIDRSIIDDAMAEFQVEVKRRVGFQLE